MHLHRNVPACSKEKHAYWIVELNAGSDILPNCPCAFIRNGRLCFVRGARDKTTKNRASVDNVEKSIIVDENSVLLFKGSKGGGSPLASHTFGCWSMNAVSVLGRIGAKTVGCCCALYPPVWYSIVGNQASCCRARGQSSPLESFDAVPTS